MVFIIFSDNTYIKYSVGVRFEVVKGTQIRCCRFLNEILSNLCFYSKIFKIAGSDKLVLRR